MIYRIFDRTYNFLQKKGQPELKRVYLLSADKQSWSLAFEGTKEEETAWIKKQKKLWLKREAREMIADICGTSYRAAMADMGMSHN